MKLNNRNSNGDQLEHYTIDGGMNEAISIAEEESKLYNNEVRQMISPIFLDTSNNHIEGQTIHNDMKTLMVVENSNYDEEEFKEAGIAIEVQRETPNEL